MSTEWIKSSYSGNGEHPDSTCLEWKPARIPSIRDSKTAPRGATLHVPAAAWAEFVTAIRTGTLSI